MVLVAQGFICLPLAWRQVSYSRHIEGIEKNMLLPVPQPVTDTIFDVGLRS